MKFNLAPRSEEGFSLIEILIVLAILGVIVTFAVLALGRSSEVIDRQNIAKEFKVALERARFDSVKRRPATCEDMSRVEILSATSFRYITDTNQDGTLQPDQEFRVVNFGDRSQVKIVTDPAIVFPITIRFDLRGHTSSGPCNVQTEATTPTHFCETGCSVLNNSNSTSIYVSPTGTVSLLSGGEDVPIFEDPNVTQVSSNSGINQYLAVWTGTPPTPTPVGTPIETGTPDPEPTIPSEEPTPEPTPLPTCSRNQRPGNPPTCACLPPYFVQGNGQCK